MTNKKESFECILEKKRRKIKTFAINKHLKQNSGFYLIEKQQKMNVYCILKKDQK